MLRLESISQNKRKNSAIFRWKLRKNLWPKCVTQCQACATAWRYPWWVIRPSLHLRITIYLFDFTRRMCVCILHQNWYIFTFNQFIFAQIFRSFLGIFFTSSSTKFRTPKEKRLCFWKIRKCIQFSISLHRSENHFIRWFWCKKLPTQLKIFVLNMNWAEKY